MVPHLSLTYAKCFIVHASYDASGSPPLTVKYNFSHFCRLRFRLILSIQLMFLVTEENIDSAKSPRTC